MLTASVCWDSVTVATQQLRLMWKTSDFSKKAFHCWLLFRRQEQPAPPSPRPAAKGSQLLKCSVLTRLGPLQRSLCSAAFPHLGLRGIWPVLPQGSPSELVLQIQETPRRYSPKAPESPPTPAMLAVDRQVSVYRAPHGPGVTLVKEPRASMIRQPSYLALACLRGPRPGFCSHKHLSFLQALVSRPPESRAQLCAPGPPPRWVSVCPRLPLRRGRACRGPQGLMIPPSPPLLPHVCSGTSTSRQHPNLALDLKPTFRFF